MMVRHQKKIFLVLVLAILQAQEFVTPAEMQRLTMRDLTPVNVHQCIVNEQYLTCDITFSSLREMLVRIVIGEARLFVGNDIVVKGEVRLKSEYRTRQNVPFVLDNYEMRVVSLEFARPELSAYFAQLSLQVTIDSELRVYREYSLPIRKIR